MLSGQSDLRVLVQAVDVALERPVGEKAQRPGDHDRIVQPPQFDIRLADHRDSGQLAADELAFHGGERDGLMPADHLGLLVAGRKGHQQRRNKTCERPIPEPKPRLIGVDAAQGVESTQGRHDKRSGHERRNLVMAELD